MVKQKTEDDNNAIEADKKGQWSCLEQFLVLGARLPEVCYKPFLYTVTVMKCRWNMFPQLFQIDNDVQIYREHGKGSHSQAIKSTQKMSI